MCVVINLDLHLLSQLTNAVNALPSWCVSNVSNHISEDWYAVSHCLLD